MTTMHHDGGDIDYDGKWLLNGVSCRECRQDGAREEPAMPPRYYVVVLACAECGAELTPPFDAFTKRVQ